MNRVTQITGNEKNPQRLKILMISVKFLDKTINRGNLGTTLKNYYERNSRGFVLFDLTYRTISVPFKHSQQNGPTKAFEFIKKLLPNSFDIYVVLSNPKTSGYARKFVKTWASTTNVIHEVGHALGLSHANMTIYGRLQTSRDMFSQMTTQAPYKSMNSVHLLQLGWLRPNEIVEHGEGENIYKLVKITDFENKIDLKIVKIGKFLISYVDHKGIDYIAVHKYSVNKPSGFFKWSSTLVARSVANYKVEKGIKLAEKLAKKFVVNGHSFETFKPNNRSIIIQLHVNNHL